eukprot:CAMPEP_0204564878 /NCGR_PEP_ID=MMETSP0661-20131031/35144_1 /ASSEMBLY_ACC=CAM_ASM_000606 /TAXON_ID=109239 /ORGANISM="Alexandrium margalefi, Strain AMGDE01CS-322" /LENGTH=287 /DNA_ID=CAMNT_0051572569 /DNA_START=40 /DNA_END=903 /DNA_ORIENTATION=-
MQPMTWQSLLTLLAAVPQGGCEYAAVRQHAAHRAAASLTAQWAAAAEAEADDRRFWTSEWSAMEAELLQIQDAAESAERKPKNAAFMQLNNGSQADAPARKHSPLTEVKINLNPKSAADLVPALAMLKGLYEDGKQRIAQLNAREQQYKQHFAEKQAEHDARIAHIAAQNGTVSDEFRANETRDENRLFSYWQRVRERQHHQFHTSLKIQHATLEKVKKMIDMYDKAIAGKEEGAQAQKDLARISGGAMPEVVLLQGAWRETAAFCAEALKEIKAAGEELGADGPEP